MPHKNRSDPFGDLHAVSQRGTLMGNRGNLHDADGTIHRKFKRKAWVACALEFKGRHQVVMAPGRYTQLFFLDEATALSAGHRPCGTCRKDALSEFKRCWRQAKGMRPEDPVNLKVVGNTLHDERMGETWYAPLKTLPDGTMVQVTPDGGPHLWWHGRLLQWSFDGYGSGMAGKPEKNVAVITPRSLVEVLNAEYPIGVHPSTES